LDWREVIRVVLGVSLVLAMFFADKLGYDDEGDI